MNVFEHLTKCRCIEKCVTLITLIYIDISHLEYKKTNKTQKSKNFSMTKKLLANILHCKIHTHKKLLMELCSPQIESDLLNLSFVFYCAMYLDSNVNDQSIVSFCVVNTVLC